MQISAGSQTTEHGEHPGNLLETDFWIPALEGLTCQVWLRAQDSVFLKTSTSGVSNAGGLLLERNPGGRWGVVLLLKAPAPAACGTWEGEKQRLVGHYTQQVAASLYLSREDVLLRCLIS